MPSLLSDWRYAARELRKRPSFTLTAASAAGKGFLRLVKADLGYDPHRTMSLPIPVHENTHVSWQDRSEYFEQIRAKIAAMPQVVAARAASIDPLEALRYE